MADQSPLLPTQWDRVRYVLTGSGRYAFYVRRYGNTLTWTYGTAEDAALRVEVRQPVIARNERRAAKGQLPLDVEAEVERQMELLDRA